MSDWLPYSEPRLERVEEEDHPTAKEHNQYTVFGMNVAYCYAFGPEVYSPPFHIFAPMQQRVKDRSKYMPHQGKQECERRMNK